MPTNYMQETHIYSESLDAAESEKKARCASGLSPARPVSCPPRLPWSPASFPCLQAPVSGHRPKRLPQAAPAARGGRARHRPPRS